MYIFDNKISIENREILEEYLNGYEYKTSGLSFSAMYMWRNINEFSWDIIGDYMCITGISHLELEEGIILPFLFPPLTKTGEYDRESLRETILKCKEIFESQGHPFSLRLVPFHLMEIIKDACPEISFKDDRPNYDYVYLTQELIDLKGRAFHGKKNHLNYFLRNYSFTYEEATVDMVPEIMAYIRSKNEYKLGETPEEWKEILELETIAIEELLKFVGRGLLTGIIRIDGRIEAVTLGEFAKTNSKETVLVHVEKADDRVRGLYQAINNEFCKRLPVETVYVNREEDMGMENLRQTKLSYKPVKMEEKYTATFK